MKRLTTALSFSLAIALAAASVGCDTGTRVDPKQAALAGVSSSTTGGTTSGTTGGGTGAPALAVTEVQPASNGARLSADTPALVINFAASGAPVDLNDFTITASGSVDEAVDLGGLKLYGDDNKNGQIDTGEQVMANVSSPAFIMNDGTRKIVFTNPITIAAGADLQVIVAVDAKPGTGAAGKIGETLAFSIAAAVDVTAASNGTPLTAGGTYPLGATAQTLFIHDHLLISEIVATPSAGEYIEIFNPTAQTVDLRNYYLTDQSDSTLANTYYRMPEGKFDSGNTADFIVRFPANAQIKPGETITVAIDGVGFQTTYGTPATYSCRNAAGSSIDMLTPGAGSAWSVAPIAPFAELFDTGESVVLFHWDTDTDTVQDVDYVFYGNAASVGSFNLQWDKSGISVDGPDSDSTPSTYLNETPVAQQSAAPVAPAPNNGIQRVDFSEGTETPNSGNGITANDETSENWAQTFSNGTPTPGQP